MKQPNPLAVRLYDIICRCPGIGKAQLAKRLDIPTSRIGGLLAALEGAELLVSENEGKLYEFKK